MHICIEDLWFISSQPLYSLSSEICQSMNIYFENIYFLKNK